MIRCIAVDDEKLALDLLVDNIRQVPYLELVKRCKNTREASEVLQPEIPNGMAIIASDDATKALYMLYFDERKVSRKYEVSFNENVMKWWRNAPCFSQRFSLTLIDNGNTIVSKGEMSKDGSTWEKDLTLSYTRIEQNT